MEVCLPGVAAVNNEGPFSGPDADAGTVVAVAADYEPEFRRASGRQGDVDALDAARCTVQDVDAVGYFGVRKAERSGRARKVKRNRRRPFGSAAVYRSMVWREISRARVMGLRQGEVGMWLAYSQLFIQAIIRRRLSGASLKETAA